MPTPLHHVDAFTDTPFAGNPAGVCLLDAPTDEAWMAGVAAEVNLSETAFTWPLGPGRWGLRWWTPTVEVPLCGHATLAAAHVLRESGQADSDEVMTFVTAAGDLAARGRGERIELDFPAYERRDLLDDEVEAVQAVIDGGAAEVTGYAPRRSPG